MGAFEEKMRVLVDSCIVLDALANREPFCVDAQKIFFAIERSYIKGCIAANMLMNVHYVMRRMSLGAARSRLAVRGMMKLLDVVELRESDMEWAFDADWGDFEDAVATAVAVRERVDVIVTRNVRDFRESPVPVLTPEEFVRRYFEERDLEW